MIPLAALLFDLDRLVEHAETIGAEKIAAPLRAAVRAIEERPDVFVSLYRPRKRSAPGKRCSAKQIVLRQCPGARCVRQYGGLLYAVYLDPADPVPIARDNGAQECWALAAERIAGLRVAGARARGLA
jgi:hypothetical protein